MPFQPYDTGRPAVQEAARTLSHGDELLTKLLLDAWYHHMNVEDYISILMRPQNPGPYIRRINTLSNEGDRLRYYRARPPREEELVSAPATVEQRVSTDGQQAGRQSSVVSGEKQLMALESQAPVEIH
jgi:hypothetical protein